ncbi:phospholipid phosphatase 1 isoform X2 [Agrilus planipennis]|uniref:Phospholipid phosphatase 1 isoform X2 n=1 Tax=Agrilus planipennis TaxID=224129 RepID=A0A1W4WFP8_AGRPL|nr:phospholipid phosphatase 1 isoform X2 [Agrilus planipennis]
MYNNHHQGIYTIRGDMCYENKLMANVALPERPMEATCLTVPESDLASASTNTCKQRRNQFLNFPFISNVVIAIIVGVLLFLLEYGYFPQNKLGYFCKDPSISKSFNGDTITWVILLVGSLGGPLIIFFVIEYEAEVSLSRYCCLRVCKLYRDFIIGGTFNIMIVEVAKSIVGEHRPHFIATCAPSKHETCEAGSYITDYICTIGNKSRYFEIDSSRSFPSGHASLSVFVGLFCAAYINRRLNVKKTGIVFKIFLMFICIAWSMTCSLTRITDHRHHWWDVLFGSIIGVVTVYYTVKSLCNNFETDYQSKPSKPTASASTTALLDLKNKDATSVII